MSHATKPRYSEGSTILHRCGPDDEGCMCMYDPECTGRFSRRLVPIPVWLGIILWPRQAWRILRARRILKSGGDPE